MAQKMIVQLVDDIDGTTLEDGEGETVTFALDGTSYQMDLSHANADKFRGLLDEYVSCAQRITKSSGTRTKRTTTAPADGPSATEIRTWAQEQGISISERGRVSAEIREAYAAAH